MAKIFIFRHGETTDNREHIFSGWRDVDLTPEGVQEAKGIGEKLRAEIVTKAYQSDLIRSKHTLEIVLNGFHQGVEVITDPRIKERDYGNLTGKNKDEIEKEYPKFYPMWHRSYEEIPPGGESLKMVEERVLPFIEEMKANLKKDDLVFISAHGNSIRPMRRYFEHLSTDEISKYEYTPGEIFEYQI
ncbi:MAG TPA: histidine phosphatase family protein [Candidatus Sulfotelmatobacter sp.]|nr:histidine phosphatase family protein [Candidatus Sulfotelmatobacter sp.]